VAAEVDALGRRAGLGGGQVGMDVVAEPVGVGVEQFAGGGEVGGGAGRLNGQLGGVVGGDRSHGVSCCRRSRRTEPAGDAPSGPVASIGDVVRRYGGRPSEDAMSQVRTDRLDASWVETLDRVRAFVTARVGDPDLAADITQDVVVRSIASGALDRVDNPAAWLYRSARNAVIDHYRTRHVHDPFDGDDTWPDPGSADNEPNDATRELARCLQPMLHELPPAARDALTRVDVDGQTHQQAAEQLGLSVSGMKSRVQRARRQLKDLLQQCCTVGVDGTGAVASYRLTGPTCGCGATAPSDT
jgi:RNA polymerase sigma-70 factor (ECF subfamily)